MTYAASTEETDTASSPTVSRATTCGRDSGATRGWSGASVVVMGRRLRVNSGPAWSTLPPVDPIDLLKLLLDPARLAVAGALAAADAPLDGSELATRAGTDQRTALETVATLVDAGLAERTDAGFCLHEDGWRTIAAEVATEPEPPDVTIGHGMTRDEQDVLARWFEGRRLTRLPTSRQQRRVVLERLALEFEPGRRYPETEVNSILGRFHDDWSTLRRALVDNGFLDRANNQYWRAGGRVPT